MWCLVKDSGRAPHKFGTYIYILFVDLLSIVIHFSQPWSLWWNCVFVSVYWITVTPFPQPPNPPLHWHSVLDPPYLFLCICHHFILFTICPFLPIFFYPWEGTQNKGRWEGCPVPTFRLSHSHRNTPAQHTLSAHAQCLTPLSNLHMRQSS